MAEIVLAKLLWCSNSSQLSSLGCGKQWLIKLAMDQLYYSLTLRSVCTNSQCSSVVKFITNFMLRLHPRHPLPKKKNGNETEIVMTRNASQEDELKYGEKYNSCNLKRNFLQIMITVLLILAKNEQFIYFLTCQKFTQTCLKHLRS